MTAATAVLVLCLAASSFGDSCIKTPKPRHDCRFGPTEVFFAHPQDCTVVIVCIGTVDIAVSLCDDPEYLNIHDPDHKIGCRDKCSQIEGGELPIVPPSSTALTTTEASPTTSCKQRPKLSYDCSLAHLNAFFPHPSDCTVLVVCIGTLDIMVSLCDNPDYLNILDPGRKIGCRERCSLPEGGAPSNAELSSTEVPGLKVPSSEVPSSEVPGSEVPGSEVPSSEVPSLEPSNKEPSNQELSTTEPIDGAPPNTEVPLTEAANPMPPNFNAPSTKAPVWDLLNNLTSSYRPSPGSEEHPDDHDDCVASGVYKHPTDCLKAFFCPSVGAHPVEVDICEESKRNPDFVQGCRGNCQF